MNGGEFDAPVVQNYPDIFDVAPTILYRTVRQVMTKRSGAEAVTRGFREAGGAVRGADIVEAALEDPAPTGRAERPAVAPNRRSEVSARCV